jgi:hypothetical protein
VGNFRHRREGVFHHRREGAFRHRREGVFHRRREGVFHHRREGAFRHRREGVFHRRPEGVFRHHREGAFRRRHREGSCMGACRLGDLHRDMLEGFPRRPELSSLLPEAEYLGHRSRGAGLLHREGFDRGQTRVVRLRPVRADQGSSLAALRRRVQPYAEHHGGSFWGHEGYEPLVLAWSHIQRACAERTVWPGAWRQPSVAHFVNERADCDRRRTNAHSRSRR